MTPFDVSLLERLHQTLDRHIDQPDYSIDELCAELGVSRSRLFREIKQQTGFSTALYIRHRRLLKAWQLLESTSLRVSEIADRTGFSSSQDLSRYFAESFGCSPSDYRKRFAEASQPPPHSEEPARRGQGLARQPAR